MKAVSRILNCSVNTSVEIGGIVFANPIMPAAGPPVMDGDFMNEVIELGEVGGIVSKTVSLEAAKVPRPCMIKVRTSDSMLNHELWSDYPYEHWVAEEYPKVKAKYPDVPFIASAGYTEEEIGALSPILVDEGHADALELSIHYLGGDPSAMVKSIQAAKKNTGGKVPVFPKLSPNILDIQEFALAAQDAGADAIVAINSVGPCLSIDIDTGHPSTGGGPHGYGWLSGEAIKPIAVRCVYEIASVVDIPVIGCGGISSGRDVIEMIMAGASAVQICTAAIYHGPKVYKKILDEMIEFMEDNGYDSIEEMRGLAIKNNQGRPDNYLDVTVPKLYEDACTKCGSCYKKCIYGAIDWEKKQYPRFDANLCYGCGLCASFCKFGALEVDYWM